MSSAGRLSRAGLAAALGFVVLSGAGGTGAAWVDRVEREPGSLRSGGVTVTPGPTEVRLHSRQPAGSRTYASSAPCAADPGFVECRVITQTRAAEALVPGDRVVLVQRPSVQAVGNNLTGRFTVHAGPFTSSRLSELSGRASVTTTTTPPAGAAITAPEATFPVSIADGVGIGQYEVRTVVTTQPSDGATRWDARLTGERLYEGAFEYSLTQTKEGP